MKQSGFTLIEVLVVVTIIAIGFSISLPSFRATIQNNRIVAAANEMQLALSLARGQAVRLNSANVQICPSANADADAPSCVEGGDTAWTSGWVLFNDQDQDNEPDADEILQRQSFNFSGVTIDGPARDFIAFRANGLAVGFNGTFGICDVRKDDAGGYAKTRNVIVANSGRVRVFTPTQDSEVACDDLV